MQDTDYPRPQLRRVHWVSLDGGWDFAFGERTSEPVPPEPTNWPLKIQVPFAPECELSGIGDPGFHEACWYQRHFHLGESDIRDRRVLLHFGAVDYQARVWVNGVTVAEHEGGHTPFTADVTAAVDDAPFSWFRTAASYWWARM